MKLNFLTLFICIIALVQCAKVNLNAGNYQDNVMALPQVWLVEYYSTMCGSCKEFDPTFTRLAATFENQLKIGRVNIDEPEGMKLAQQQNALNDGIPSVYLVYAANGKSEQLMAGDLKSYNTLKSLVEKKLKAFKKDASGQYQKSEL